MTTAVAKGDLSQKITVDARGEILELKNTINTMVDQLSVVRRRGDPGGPRGRHRGHARRPGPGARRRRHLARPDRLGELHGRQPDRPGALDRAGRHRGGQGRPDAHHRRRRARRDPGAEEHPQHHGRPALLLRRRGHPSRPRGRHRRPARRPGRRQGRLGHLEGPHRVGQRHGRQPDRPGALHRRGHHRGRQGRPVAEDPRRRARRDPGAEGDHQHDGRPALRVRRRGHPGRPRGRHRGQPRRPGHRARRVRAPGRT